MNTPTCRFSARLREKELAAWKAATTQSKERPAQAPSSAPSTSRPSSAKRRKTDHEATEQNGPKASSISRPGVRVKGRRGHLKLMTEMPMDVLYEIFNSLEPIDLLHLSWANKSLHSIIMGKSARFLWENAFEALYTSGHPPPQCPSDLNLAQYTKLLFDKRCTECNSPHGSHVVWPHRLRVCGNCLEGNRFTVLSITHQYWLVMPMIRTFVRGRYQTYVLTSELNEVKAKMESMRPESDEWKEYVKQREEWTKNRRREEWNFTQWQREQKRDRKNELEEIRIKRRNMIIARLSELGWTEELEHLNSHQLWTFPGMRIAKPLTDKTWETLCPELIDHLEAVREFRLERERQNRIIRRCDNLARKISTWSRKQSNYNLMPQTLDVALTEPFKSYVLGELSGEPTFMTDNDEFAKSLEHFTEDWNESRNQFLASLLPKSHNGPGKASAKGKSKVGSSTKALNLATTFFQCPSCVEPISYPRVLAHECQRQPSTQANRRDTDPEDLLVVSAAIYHRPWLCDCHDLTFDQEASDVARTIIHECGENPGEITAEQMDEKECRFECVKCSEPRKGRWVMKWRMAVLHELKKHSVHSNESLSTSPPKGKKKVKQPVEDRKWRLVIDPDDLALIHAREENGGAGKSFLECKQCRSTISPELQAMQAHWNYYHSFPEMEDDRMIDHIYGVPSSTAKLPMPEEKELRAMFEVPLDRSIRDTHFPVKIPMRKKVDEDMKME